MLFFLLSTFTPVSAVPDVPTGAVVVPLVRAHDYSAYFAKFHVGTPAQVEYVEIDTGSPTVSFENPNNDVCAEASKPCKTYGYFVNSSSSTCKYINSDFGDELIDFGYGDTLQDVVTVGSGTFKDLQFGYLDDYAFPEQVAIPTHTICGLALRCDDSGTFNDSCYSTGPYLIPQLYDSGAINRRTASIYLGPEGPHINTSSLILGGAYDRAKQGPHPFTVPMASNLGQTNSANVTAISATVASNHTSTTFTPPFTVLVDTGNPFFGLCDPVWEPVYNALGAPNDTLPNGAYVVDCKYREIPANEKITVTFGAKTNTIDVPLVSLVVDMGDGSCASFIDYNGPASGGISLGDPFLRNAYVIFDQDRFEITLAQAVYTQESDIVPL